ncbi:MAG: hypothetical protein IJW94_00690 [Oscillospiraceae bacterium]|nr:hypothetical protein [Oscillospiraceae bacterium]
MKIRKLLVALLAIAMIASVCVFPVVADGANKNVIFICDDTSKGDGSGSSAENPLKPTTGNYNADDSKPDYAKDAALYQAWKKLKAAGGGTIVICGPYTLNNANCQEIGGASADFKMGASNRDPSITINYTSVWDGVDYRTTNNAELIMDDKSHITFPTTSVFENITVRATSGNNGYHTFCAGTCPMTLGKGTNFVPADESNLDTYPTIFGGFRSQPSTGTDGDGTITVDIGNENYIGNIYGMCDGGSATHKGNVTITIKSGNIGHIAGDSRATGQVPQNGDIVMNLEGGIYRGQIAGVNIGFNGKCEKKMVQINITGGDFENARGIIPNTPVADAVMPEIFNVDCSGAPMETARQVKKNVSSAANLTLPEGYTDEAPEESTGATEGGDKNDATEGTKAPANNDKPNDNKPVESNNSWIYIVIAVVAVAVVAVVVVIVIKKKKDAQAAE